MKSLSSSADTGIIPALKFNRIGFLSIATNPFFLRTYAVPRVGWPAKGISWVGVNMRTSKSASSLVEG